MEWKLTEQERKDLIAQHKKVHDRRVCDRIKAVLLRDKGYSYLQVAEILLLDDETVRRHIDDYRKLQKLMPHNGGSDSKLNPDQSAQLIAHLETTTYLYAKEICAYVLETFAVTYTVSGMIKWLRQQGFRYKKPRGMPAKAEAQKQADFILKYNELKSGLKADEVILFGDSTHPQHQTKLAYGWIKKGNDRSEKMTACQKRINIIGAIDLEKQDIEYCQVDWVNTESLKTFISQLCAAYPLMSTIHLILDNAGYHKSDEFLKFVATTKVKIHYLPPYSPNLNPIERLWKIMHENTTYNRYYAKFSEFSASILGFFENIREYRCIIKMRINDNFQKLKFASSG